MASLGIRRENIVVDFEVGDTIKVVAGAWADTVGVVQSINMQKQSLTINVELFGRETPVEIGFAEVCKDVVGKRGRGISSPGSTTRR